MVLLTLKVQFHFLVNFKTELLKSIIYWRNDTTQSLEVHGKVPILNGLEIMGYCFVAVSFNILHNGIVGGFSFPKQGFLFNNTKRIWILDDSCLKIIEWFTILQTLKETQKELCCLLASDSWHCFCL